MQGRIERTMLRLKKIVGSSLDVLADLVPVRRPIKQRVQD
jgi:hypothetical protein